MPAPAAAVYVVAIVGGVAATAAFYQFVYEPHIAPRLEIWATNFLARREAKRRQMQMLGAHASNPHDDDDHNSTSGTSGKPGVHDGGSSIELENLVSREVDEWRNSVEQIHGSSLRRRGKHSTAPSKDMNDFNDTYRPMTPTHVVFNSSCPSTPTTVRSSPGGPSASARLPTPEPSNRAASPAAPAPINTSTIHHLPHPDGAMDLEFISPRSSSPFSVVYASSTPSLPRSAHSDDDMGARTGAGAGVASLSEVASRIRMSAADNDSLSELEFLSSMSEGGDSEDPFGDDSGSSAHGSQDDDDDDTQSDSSWASATAGSPRV